MAIPTMKQLLEAGVHFGHQTRRWDPRMKPYIFTERNNIHIVDLQQTMKIIKTVHSLIKEMVADGKTVLFVGTKKQAQATVAEQAARCGMYFVSERWMGGTLTNFPTIKQSIQRLKNYEEMRDTGTIRLLPKKEQVRVEKTIGKLGKALGGIREMKAIPGILFVVDPKREEIAVREANRLSIPVVALTDTNCNPKPIDYVIPGNDDAIRSIALIASAVADAVLQGKQVAKDVIVPDEEIEETTPETLRQALEEEGVLAEEFAKEEEEEEPGAEEVRRRRPVRREGEAEGAPPVRTEEEPFE